MIVMKYGGSSVKDSEMFKRVAEIVKKDLDKNPIVVLSAVKGVTDNLIKAMKESLVGKYEAYNEIEAKHKEIISDLGLDSDIVKEDMDELKSALDTNTKLKSKTSKMLDYISFFGERMSVKILSALLNKQGVKSSSYVSGDIGLLTDSNFGDATLLDESYDNLKEFFYDKEEVSVVTGFGGKDKEGEWTTFNRGGSDYVAAIIGAAVNASEIQIWTDVSGIMTIDPRIVPEAKSLEVLSFSEAAESAFFGAKVLHPKTIKPAMDKDIPVRVLNTFEPEHKGTLILSEGQPSSEVIKVITRKRNVTVINLCSSRMLNAYGFLEQVFGIFSKYKKSVDMVTTSEVNISLTVENKENLDKIVPELEKLGNVVVENDKSLICLVGEGMKHTIGVAAKIFSILAEANISVEMVSQGASEINVSFIVKNEDADKAVKALHAGFF